jgi:hypothetical protein
MLIVGVVAMYVWGIRLWSSSNHKRRHVGKMEFEKECKDKNVFCRFFSDVVAQKHPFHLARRQDILFPKG